MKLLCFQAKRFRWKTYSKSLAETQEVLAHLGGDDAPPAAAEELIRNLA